MSRKYEYIGHSCDNNFEEKVKELILYRRIVSVNKIDSQTAEITLDNNVVLKAVGNIGCGGCENGWFYLNALNDCNNVITNVESVIEESDNDHFIFHLFVYAEDTKINAVTFSGCDNGYYGIGYHLYVKIPDKEL